VNTPPPLIVSDPLVAGPTPIEQLLRVLGIAANLSDQQDNDTNLEQHADRDATTRQAAEKFAAQDEEAAAELNDFGGDPYIATEGMAGEPNQASAMVQQLPQLASGIAAALAGAIGGALQPLAQLPQQATQGVQQALQTGMGLLQTAGSEPFEDVTPTEVSPPDDVPFGVDDFDELGGGNGGDIGTGSLDEADGGGLGSGSGTTPMAYLGPPPVPPASTAPSSAPIIPVTPVAAAPATGVGTAGMAGMPMVPPGAMGATSGTDKDVKADTKRVSVPSVRNGAPVQGRLNVPPPMPPVGVKKSTGKPVVTRRIVASGDSRSPDDKPES
jgi:hypothetical protein